MKLIRAGLGDEETVRAAVSSDIAVGIAGYNTEFAQ